MFGNPGNSGNPLCFLAHRAGFTIKADRERGIMSLSLSRRAARTVQSEIRVMSIECEKVKGINLAQGVCDTEVPEPVRDAAKRAIDGGRRGYTRAGGLEPMRGAVAQEVRT